LAVPPSGKKKRYLFLQNYGNLFFQNWFQKRRLPTGSRKEKILDHPITQSKPRPVRLTGPESFFGIALPVPPFGKKRGIYFLQNYGNYFFSKPVYEYMKNDLDLFSLFFFFFFLFFIFHFSFF
jgi:hypothetical protein